MFYGVGVNYTTTGLIAVSADMIQEDPKWLCTKIPHDIEWPASGFKFDNQFQISKEFNSF